MARLAQAPWAIRQESAGGWRPCSRTRPARSDCPIRASSRSRSDGATGPTRSRDQSGAAATVSTMSNRSTARPQVPDVHRARVRRSAGPGRGTRGPAGSARPGGASPRAGQVRVGDHGEVGARGQLGAGPHDQPGGQAGRPLGPGAVGEQPRVVLVHVGDHLAPPEGGDEPGDRDHVRVDRHHHLGLGPPRQHGGPGQPLDQVAPRAGVDSWRPRARRPDHRDPRARR